MMLSSEPTRPRLGRPPRIIVLAAVTFVVGLGAPCIAQPSPPDGSAKQTPAAPPPVPAAQGAPSSGQASPGETSPGAQPQSVPVVGSTPAGEPTADQPAPPQHASRALAPGPGQTSWDTFMYEGPGLHYMVIDEVTQGQVLSILGCSNGWCEVSYEGGKPGYVTAEVVTTSEPARPAPDFLPQPAAAIIANPPGPCVEALQTSGNGGKDPSLFCQKKSE